MGSELIDAETVASVLMPPPPIPTQKLPPGCPSWAARMKNCEVCATLEWDQISL